MSQRHITNHWLFSKGIDLLFLFTPVWIAWAICFSLDSQTLKATVPLWMWVVIVLGIDVSHVWSTIFRTYTDKDEFSRHRKLLILAPILCFIVLLTLSLISPLLFWRCMAYLALFHFIKQQYGFFMLYKRRSGTFLPKFFRDKFVIYMSMIYPILYWHFSSVRNFDWFVSGDFINLSTFTQRISWVFVIGNIVYFLILSGWLIEELSLNKKHKEKYPLSIGKILWLLTTAGNWYLGIVYFNSDIAFTLTNVVAHGIPYMVLIFFYTERKKTLSNKLRSVNKAIMSIGMMISIVLFLAFLEEYFWDALLNHERSEFFESIVSYPSQLWDSVLFKAIILALLSVPQVVHYVIDGFIWKANDKNPYLKQVFSNK